MLFKPDLHCHSYYSDGQHSPQELVQRALAQNLSHLAITDHDCVAALESVGASGDLTIIPGVEISSDWQGKEIHVIGLGIDTGAGTLRSLLETQQSSRHRRMQAMDAALQQLGITGLATYLAALPCHAPTRTHVADFLIQAGICKNHQKAFKQYLGKRGRIFVPGNWCTLIEAVTAIRDSGGMAILAHPGRYPIGKNQLRKLLRDFSAANGDGMETSYGNIDPLMQHKLQQLADEFDLFQSQGSDFHSASAHWTEVGKFPSLGGTGIKNAIWHHPRWHF